MNYIGEILSLAIILGIFFGAFGGIPVSLALFWAIAEASCYCAARYNPYLATRPAMVKRFGVASIGVAISMAVLAFGNSLISMVILAISVIIATAATDLSAKYWLSKIAEISKRKRTNEMQKNG